MTDETQDVEITAQCLCKAYAFTTSVAKSALPLQGLICHCKSCRHMTGAMYTSHVPWPGSTDDIRSSNLCRYEFTSNVSLLFCGTCSSPLFWEEYYKDRPEVIDVFTGALNNVPVQDFIKFTGQIFVEDTCDGGLSPWLQFLNEDGTISRPWRWRADKNEEFDNSLPAVDNAPKTEVKIQTSSVPIQCRCKGVDFLLRPGNVYFSSQNADSLPFFIEPTTHKHLTNFDACDSCRSTFGTEIINWTFVLLQQLDFPASSEQPDFPRSVQDLKNAMSGPKIDPRFGTLAMYKSSPDVQRYFCSRCSASVFYAVDDRPELVDVAVGVIDASEGARAE
ncbi:hypothetical protein FDECE_11229, partial [Fusarium decemcellulare]